MARRRIMCWTGRHDWAPKKSEDGQPVMLAGRAYEGCRHCDATRERPWAGGPATPSS
jgi:hypothetical protein